MTHHSYSKTMERIAQTNVNCGDDSTVQFRIVLAHGFQELSILDPEQENLTPAEAMRTAYRAIEDIASPKVPEKKDA